MQRRGQGIIGFVLIVDFLFVILWIFLLAPWYAIIGPSALAAGATGIEAAFWMNLNMVTLIFLILINLLVFKFGGD